MYEIIKQYQFSAAHALPSLPEGHKCHNLHGHNYTMELCLSDNWLDDHGMLVDFADVDWVVEPLIKKVDHQNLNDIFDFQTTSENLAHWFFMEINSMDLHARKEKEKPKYIGKKPKEIERIIHIRHRYLPLRWVSVSETPKTKAVWRSLASTRIVK